MGCETTLALAGSPMVAEKLVALLTPYSCLVLRDGSPGLSFLGGRSGLAQSPPGQRAPRKAQTPPPLSPLSRERPRGFSFLPVGSARGVIPPHARPHARARVKGE